MDLLESNEILQHNDKLNSFVLINPGRVDDDDVSIFVVKPPPPPRDPAHHAAVDSVTSLCDNCLDALKYLSYYLRLLQSKGKDAVDELPAACLLHSGAKTLEAGDDARCHLCVILMARLRAKRLAMESIDQSDIEMCWRTDGALPTRLHFALTHRGHPRAAKNYWNILRLHVWDRDEFDNRLLGLTEQSPALERDSSTESGATKENALQWLARCQTNEDGRHGQCNHGPAEWLPTRLLDVTTTVETSMLKLVIPADCPDVFALDRQYITLSHCWGKWGASQLPVLTTENMPQRVQDGVTMAELPKSFADAVQIAHWFKVRWLWIDSLCIVQDSHQDWQHEAVMMYDVYKNALLNISADDSPDGRWGCFRNRDPLAVMPLNLQFPGQDKWKCWLTPDTQAVFQSITDAPLARRGWVFQERQLSRRVLHFTSHELIWECCAEAPYFASETFPGGSPFKAVFNGKPKFQSQINLGVMAQGSEGLYTAWATICKEYSAKVFSDARDKLVALSGLAQEFEVKLQGDPYVAGFWRSTLPWALLWQSSSESHPFETKDAYLAPTWSWLSIDGSIAPFQRDQDRKQYSLVDIVNVTTVPVFDSKPTASLKSASMTLRCFMRPVEIRPDYEKKPWYMLAMGGGKAHKLIIKDEDGKESGLVDNFRSDAFVYSFDVASDENSGPESVSGFFVPLELSQPTEYNSLALSGLLVQPVGDESKRTYKRVGMMSVFGAHCARVKYTDCKDQGEGQGDWERLLKCLRATHLNYKELRTDQEQDILETKRDAKDESLEHGAEKDTEQVTQDPLSEKFEELNVVAQKQGSTVEKVVGPDLDQVETVDRLYALDGGLENSGLENNFQRLVLREIVLI
ncbi:heterokaryon incompatibility protein-domain-containing protein [Cladorrhinum sp. PSN259]|nr:heterokaryon incompatibility protein-domain-containing protein [Cladorrhinum sp. PSN259]